MATQLNDDVVSLGEAKNPQEAQLWREILEEEGIECRLVGEHFEGVFGEIPKRAPEIWVHRKNLERARAAIQQAHQTTNAREAEDE